MALRTDLVGGSLVISAPVDVRLHETVPGTHILLAQRLVAAPRSLRVGGPVPGLGRRLARALAVVDRAWPRAGEEIRERTWMVVPLVEPGTVSYSHLSRPGISYINVFRGSLLHLCDDLLHETAHHRLHARQEVERFLRDDGDALYYSPWRRTLRPLNGILHGTYTFLYRAELFLRILRKRQAVAGKQRRRLLREAGRELANCSTALTDLARADREGLLTPEGGTLVRGMRRRHALLRKGRLSAPGLFSIL